MSSAMNHRRRSHRSEMRKGGVYRASMRKWTHSAPNRRRLLARLPAWLRRLMFRENMNRPNRGYMGKLDK